jgi:hypothetical protein
VRPRLAIFIRSPPPAANLAAVEIQAATFEFGVQLPPAVPELAAENRPLCLQPPLCPVRRLQPLEGGLDLGGQFAIGPQVHGALPALLPPGEPIVGPHAAAAALPVAGNDRALVAEQILLLSQQLPDGSAALVNSWAIFQWLVPLVERLCGTGARLRLRPEIADPQQKVSGLLFGNEQPQVPL